MIYFILQTRKAFLYSSLPLSIVDATEQKRGTKRSNKKKTGLYFYARNK